MTMKEINGGGVPAGTGEHPRPLDNSWWVIPGKFLAGEYPGSPDPGEALGKLAALAAAGVTTFIDLTEPREGLVPYGPLLERPPLGGVRRLSFPIPDGSVPPTREARNRVLDAVDAALDRGGILYLHCRGGAGRTGLIAGCWQVRHGDSGREAIDRVSELWKGCPKSAEMPPPPLNIVQQLYLLCESVPPAAAPARLSLGISSLPAAIAVSPVPEVKSKAIGAFDVKDGRMDGNQVCFAGLAPVRQSGSRPGGKINRNADELISRKEKGGGR